MDAALNLPFEGCPWARFLTRWRRFSPDGRLRWNTVSFHGGRAATSGLLLHGAERSR